MNATTNRSTLEIAVAKAAEWRLISLLLERPRSGWHQELEALCKEITDPLLGKAVANSRNAREEIYLAYLGPSGHISPREVRYIGFEDPGHMLADIASFYQAFAYSPSSEDPEDHIAVEAGFYGFLKLKEAYALESGNAEGADVTRESQEHFLVSHLSRLIRGVAAKRRELPDYISNTLEAMQQRIAHIPDRAGVPKSVLPDPLATGCPFEEAIDDLG